MVFKHFIYFIFSGTNMPVYKFIRMFKYFHLVIRIKY